MELDSERNNNEESNMPQDISRQKRRLLDIAWKMYDITSEMFYLKSDVASLTSKVASLEALGVKDGRDDRGENVGMKSEENLSPTKEVGNEDIKELLNQRKTRVYGRDKQGSMLGMDNLSFSIFKEIVGEIAAESVEKIIGVDSELEILRLRNLEDLRKNRERRQGKERDQDLRQEEKGKPIYWKHSSEPKLFVKKTTEDAPTNWRYCREKSEDQKRKDLACERDLQCLKLDPFTMKKRVTFRRHDSNIEDEPPPDDAFFSRLNDSLYFHRSHLSPTQNSRHKFKRNNSSGKMSPVFSSDGSDLL